MLGATRRHLEILVALVLLYVLTCRALPGWWIWAAPVAAAVDFADVCISPTQ